MTPERLGEIRFHFRDSPDEAVAGELLAEVDRLRDIFAGQVDALTKVYAAVASPPDEFEGETDASVLHDALVMRLRSFEDYVERLRRRHNELAQGTVSHAERGALIAIACAIAGIQAQGRTLGLFEGPKPHTYVEVQYKNPNALGASKEDE